MKKLIETLQNLRDFFLKFGSWCALLFLGICATGDIIILQIYKFICTTWIYPVIKNDFKILKAVKKYYINNIWLKYCQKYFIRLYAGYTWLVILVFTMLDNLIQLCLGNIKLQSWSFTNKQVRQLKIERQVLRDVLSLKKRNKLFMKTSWLSLQLRLWKFSNVFRRVTQLCRYVAAYLKYYCKFLLHIFNLKLTRIFTLVAGQPVVFSNYKNIGHFLTRNGIVLSVVYWIHKILINLFLKKEEYQNIWNYILPQVIRHNDWQTVSSLWENYFYQYTYKEEIFGEDFESFANEEVLKIYEIYDKDYDQYQRQKEMKEAKYTKAYILSKRLNKSYKQYGQDLFQTCLHLFGIQVEPESFIVKVGGMFFEYPLKFIRYLEGEVTKTLRKIIRKVAPESFRDPHFKKLPPEEQLNQEHLPRLTSYLSFLMTPIRAVNLKNDELVSKDRLAELTTEYYRLMLAKRGRLTNIYSFMQTPFNIADKNCFSFLIRLNYYGMRDDLLGYILVVYLYLLLYIIFKSLRSYLKQSLGPLLVAFYFEYFKMSKALTTQIDELYEQFWPSYLKLKYEKISGLRQEIEPYKLVYFSSMQSDTWGFEYQYLLELMEGVWHSPYDNPLYMVPLVNQQLEAVSGWLNKFYMDNKTLDFQLKQGVSKEMVPMRIRYALRYISFTELIAKREFERKYMIDRGILHGVHTFKSLIYKEFGMLAQWFKFNK